MRRWSAIVPVVYIIFLMLPIYWLLNMSFKTTNEILGSFTLWPHTFTLDNYRIIFTDPTWYNGYIASIEYVVINTVLSVAVALPALAQQSAAPQPAPALPHGAFVLPLTLRGRALSVLVLPAPFGPRRPKISPRPIRKLTSETALLVP